ncbi:protein lifeguard 4-like [Sycon ciliatum]|uniref:protein lifeguard 4-like n=1 Tax=Sycon ciliatum TaxID=27933 RepID=UPI0020AE93AD|eukprot:scpid2190/ scgid13144/ Protein lifeguard 4; Transmembrane BAX inhibitor motif-containing protein 4; Z-protein
MATSTWGGPVRDGKGKRNADAFDVEAQVSMEGSVSSVAVAIRMGFLRKVYCILTAQLALTTLVCVLFMASKTVKSFVQSTPAALYLAMGLSFILIFSLIAKRHETPTNMYLLFAFTLVESYTVGTVVTFYDQKVVAEAAMLTLTVFIALTIYTLQSKRDFSAWYAGLFTALWILIGAGVMQIFLHSETLEMMMAAGGAFLFSLFIIFDTHMLMHKLSPEEYILASINLYLDIINLFLEILRLLNEANKN